MIQEEPRYIHDTEGTWIHDLDYWRNIDTFMIHEEPGYIHDTEETLIHDTEGTWID